MEYATHMYSWTFFKISFSTTDGKKVITVRVQPPPPRQQTPSSATMASFSVVKKEIEDEEDDDAQFLTEDEMEESCNSDSGMAKREYIVVNLPEGTTIKQQYVPSRERLEVKVGCSFYR